MTVIFHSINYTSHTFNKIIYKHGKSYGERVNLPLAIPPSSVFFRTDENINQKDAKKISDLNTSSKSGNLGGVTLLKHDTTIGIIGGVCTSSTLNFLNKLVEFGKKDRQSCPSFVLCSDPILNKEILPYERSSYTYYASKNKEFTKIHAPVIENIRLKRGFLETSGARCIVMPCHILHSWYDDVSCGCSIPILHVGECVARELKEDNLKPIVTGNPPRIGVLATESTLVGFYQDKLQNEGFEVVLPDNATMEHTIIPAIEALNMKDLVGARNLLRIALQVLLVRAVNVIVLASDDLCGLLPHGDPLLKKCIDPMDALARSAINLARSYETRVVVGLWILFVC